MGLRLVLATLLAATMTIAARAEPIPVVASFSILADFARNVGGDRVAVTALVGPGGDSHVYTPTPADARTVAAARLVVVNGLGFEGWLPRLVKAAGGKAIVIEAAKGVAPRKAADDDHDHGHDHSHDAVDPHAWQAVANAKIYVTNIRDALIAIDAAGTDAYRARATAYLAQLDALEAEVRKAVATIPAARRKVISSHAAFGYFADRYGIAFIAPQGVSTEAEPSARAVAALIRQIKRQQLPAVFLENMTDPRLARRIAAETGAKIGGTLYADSLTAENGPAPTYIAMVRHNIKALTDALSD
ncbi:MAG: ABC transporter substrate-binding protein [Proteobacteria bacterium]|nr:MAG: ABC transporter substrate-binding protein [Pseudomonadota bacterium]